MPFLKGCTCRVRVEVKVRVRRRRHSSKDVPVKYERGEALDPDLVSEIG